LFLFNRLGEVLNTKAHAHIFLNRAAEIIKPIPLDRGLVFVHWRAWGKWVPRNNPVCGEQVVLRVLESYLFQRNHSRSWVIWSLPEKWDIFVCHLL